jgi:hypothetical protein
MARYGQFKYGGAKYGAVATSNLLWSVEVDWDNDSYFDGSSEAGRLLSISLSRGRDGQFSAGGDGSAKLQRMQTGQCTIKLDNYDRRFDPWYTSSPLYPNVQPGRGMRIRVKNGNTGSVYGVFLGKIDDIQSGKPITDLHAGDLGRMADAGRPQHDGGAANECND